MVKQFRDFIIRGNILDLAVAFILGAAFSVIVKSLVSDILMPPIGLILGDASLADMFVTLRDGQPTGPYATSAAAIEAGAVTMNYGVFLDGVIAFIILAFSLFLILRFAKKIQERNKAAEVAATPKTRDCPYCLSPVKLDAAKCAFCTSELIQEPA